MLEKFLRANERLEGNPIGSHLQALATCLVEDGYADETIRSKLKLLADFGRWLARTGLTVAHLEEGHVSAFVKRRQQVRRGDLRTLEQFLEHLRKRAVMTTCSDSSKPYDYADSAPNPIPSPTALSLKHSA